MRLGKNLVILTAILGASVFGCSKSSSTAPAAATGNTVFNNAMTTVDTQLTAIDGVMPDTSGSDVVSSAFRSTGTDEAHARAAFGANWATTPALSNPRCSGGSTTICSTAVTPKEWMSYQFDPDAVRENGSSINIFGRFKNAKQIACALMNLLPVDANGYPNDGSATVTFTTSSASLLETKCGFPPGEAPTAGLQISLTVTTPSDTTVYDKKITMALPADMGGADQVFYLRTNSTAINLLTTEYNATDGQISRTIVAYDVATTTLRVEYLAANGTTTNDGFNFYRVFYDTTNDTGSMFGYEADGADSGGIRYALSTKPATGVEAALSMDLKGWGSGKNWDADYKACITKSTGDIGTDNTLTCSDATGTDIDDSSLASVYADAFSNRASTGWVTAITDTTTLSFTASTIFSALSTH